MRRLARRDHSSHELETALLRRGYPQDEIEGALERLSSEGLLNDLKFAESTATRRIGRDRLGRHRVRQELFRRGVDPKTLEDGLARALTEVSEAEALEGAARKYWASHARVPAESRVRRLHAFLVRRGYPSPAVRACIRKLWPRLEDAFAGSDPEEEMEA